MRRRILLDRILLLGRVLRLRCRILLLCWILLDRILLLGRVLLIRIP